MGRANLNPNAIGRGTLNRGNNKPLEWRTYSANSDQGSRIVSKNGTAQEREREDEKVDFDSAADYDVWGAA